MALNTIKNKDVLSEPLYDLRKFVLTRILNNNTGRKSIVLLGTFPDVHVTDEAIVVLEKQAFRDEAVSGSNSDGDNTVVADSSKKVFNERLNVNLEFINNIYCNFQCLCDGDWNAIHATVIYPATTKHIEKYTICKKYIISETHDLYEKITLPFIEASQFSLQWVYNILDHKQEEERIVFEDNDPETGFILLPDMKWDGQNVETLYLLAISHKRDIKSLRDLRAEHLPLLRNIRMKTAQAVEQRYGIPATQLRMYFHYQPSFYHLHVHVNPLRNDVPGIYCEKSHMLETVISNLELLSNYYKRVTLPFVVYDGNKLLETYEKELPIQKQLTTATMSTTATTGKRQQVCEDVLEGDTEPSAKQAKVQ